MAHDLDLLENVRTLARCQHFVVGLAYILGHPCGKTNNGQDAKKVMVGQGWPVDILEISSFWKRSLSHLCCFWDLLEVWMEMFVSLIMGRRPHGW